jgi:hypothetical protein
MSEPVTNSLLEANLVAVAPGPRALCLGMRSLVLGLHPDATELVWPRLRIVSFGFGPKKMTEHYCYVAWHREHVNLGFYRGSLLVDVQSLLEGSGKMMRHVKLSTPGDLQPVALRELVVQAIAERRSALAKA